MTKDLKEQLQFNIEESIKETEQKLDTIPKNCKKGVFMSIIEKVKELWNSNCDDYYITDINNNVISSFYFGEAFKSENADKILKQSEETILDWFIENKWGHCILKVQLKGENL